MNNGRGGELSKGSRHPRQDKKHTLLRTDSRVSSSCCLLFSAACSSSCTPDRVASSAPTRCACCRWHAARMRLSQGGVKGGGSAAQDAPFCRGRPSCWRSAAHAAAPRGLSLHPPSWPGRERGGERERENQKKGAGWRGHAPTAMCAPRRRGGGGETHLHLAVELRVLALQGVKGFATRLELLLCHRACILRRLQFGAVCRQGKG